MKLPPFFLVAISLAFASCEAFKQSATWEKVREVRTDGIYASADPSAAYAARLHTALRGVDHKIVIYQFRYGARMREDALSTRTAVIYRDDSDAKNPWWLKDETTSRPIWLPNGTVETQVSFYLRRHADVIALREYSGEEEGKGMVATEHCAACRQCAGPQDFAGLFRKKNGTDFDPASALDRQKMEALTSGAHEHSAR